MRDGGGRRKERKQAIAIFYEHVNREYAGITLLKKELEKQGCNVHLFSSMYGHLKSVAYSVFIRFDKICVPYVYSERSLYPYIGLSILNQDAIFINLQYE